MRYNCAFSLMAPWLSAVLTVGILKIRSIRDSRMLIFLDRHVSVSALNFRSRGCLAFLSLVISESKFAIKRFSFLFSNGSRASLHQ